MKVTNTNGSLLQKLDELGVSYDEPLKQAKLTITEDNKKIKAAQDKYTKALELHSSHTCTAECDREEINLAMSEKSKLCSSLHPGYIVPFDNLEIHLSRKTMTMEFKNKDFHWVNHQMVENRVSGNALPNSAPKQDLIEVCNKKFLPTMEDQTAQRYNYIIICSRILVGYFEALAPLADACIQHMPHKYSNELSKKTTRVCKQGSTAHPACASTL